MPKPVISPRFKGQIRVSASRIKTMLQCSYLFYLEQFELLPQREHPRTTFGSMVHAILECLTRPRHRKSHDLILAAGSAKAAPSVARMARRWQQRYKLEDEIMADLDGCLMVALLYSDVLGLKADEVLQPEWEFYIEGRKFAAKGFLDRLVREGDVMVIRDYKTKTLRSGKANEKELMEEFEIQATMYQLAVWKYFKRKARVEFYMLRCPPTDKKPTAHIRVFEPKNETQLRGAELYYEWIGEFFRRFSLKDAYSHFLGANRAKKYFCDYVCQFKKPFDYQSVTKDGDVVRNVLLTDKVELKEGEELEIRTHKGCPFFARKATIKA